jgi:hypothetical protein
MDTRMDTRMATGMDTRMDTNMDDDYDDDRLGAGRGYGSQDPRMDPRMDSRMDPRMDQRQDPRQQPPISRHSAMPSVSQGYQQESYQSLYQVQPVSSTLYNPASEPRTVGPNTTPPPPMSRVGQTMYSGGFPITTTAGFPISATVAPASTARYADAASNRNVQGGYSSGGPYPPDRHAPPPRR